MNWKTNALAATALMLLVSGCGVGTGANASNTNGGSQNTSASTANQQTTGSSAGNTANTAQASPPVGNFSPLVGKAAPGFTVKTLNGKNNVSLKGLLKKGEPILVNAFASWCPPCNMEAPDLVNLAKKYKGKVQVVGVDMTGHDTVSGLKKFVKEHSITYPVLLDTKGTFANKYGVTAYPSTFAISPSGKVILFHLGYMTKQDMNVIAQKLIKSS